MIANFNTQLEKLRTIEEIDIPKLINEIDLIKKQLYNEDKRGEIYWDLIFDMKNKKKKLKKMTKMKTNYILENCSKVFTYYEKKDEIKNKSNKVFGIFSKEKTVSTEDRCVLCHLGEMIDIIEEGCAICNNIHCGYLIRTLNNFNPFTNLSAFPQVIYTGYLRLNHFKEILKLFQGKESTQIPSEILCQIKLRIKKERKDVTKMTNHSLRFILISLKLPKYLVNVAQINNLLGNHSPIFSDELTHKLIGHFTHLQNVWALYKPDTRSNFFSYSFILSKFFVMCNVDHFIPYLEPIKDVNKKLEQDKIWDKIIF
jgi:hypothetical protein